METVATPICLAATQYAPHRQRRTKYSRWRAITTAGLFRKLDQKDILPNIRINVCSFLNHKHSQTIRHYGHK